MRNPSYFTFVTAVAASMMAGCGSSVMTSGGTGPSGATAPVSISMTDDPPAGVSVLFFQVSLTGATLTSASGTSVSLLDNNTPIQIDVSQLKALTAFLNNANVAAGTYTGLSLTFANPKLVVYNTSDTALGSSCAVGSICQLAPTIDNSATVNFSGAPFPMTVSANTPLGLLVDFHLNTVIQQDLSVNLGVANGITLSQLPAVAASAVPPFGWLTGTVGTVNTSQNDFTLVTFWGKTFTIDVNSNTAFVDGPPCASPGTLTCLQPGTPLQVHVASVEGDGDLLAAELIWIASGTTNQQIVEGTVIWFDAGHIKLLLHSQFPSATAVPLGGVATVAIDSGAGFSIDSNGFTLPSGAVFSNFENLTYGQDLRVAVDSGSLSCAISNIVGPNWGPPTFCTFSTKNVQLEPSQMTGTISAISAPNFTLARTEGAPCVPLSDGSVACPASMILIQTQVETTSQTAYQGFNPDSFSGLAVNDVVSVRGWIIEQDNGMLDTAMTPPYIVAQSIRLR